MDDKNGAKWNGAMDELCCDLTAQFECIVMMMMVMTMMTIILMNYKLCTHDVDLRMFLMDYNAEF